MADQGTEVNRAAAVLLALAVSGCAVENRIDAMSVPKTVVPLHKFDVDTLARTIYGEARGEPITGQVAVGWVILNRAKRGPPRFPATIAGVCKAKHQFTCWSPSDPNARLCAIVSDADPSFVIATFVAAGVLSGQFTDPVQGADHYYAKSMVYPPAWAKAMIPVGAVGGHLFFKEP
jgi:spore germination cell wall hydrolase CwlJ-like protein